MIFIYNSLDFNLGAQNSFIMAHYGDLQKIHRQNLPIVCYSYKKAFFIYFF